MSNTIDALFAGMAQKEIFGKGQYFEAGIFEVKLKTFTVKPDGFNGASFISEFEVITSSNPEVQPGVTRSFVMLFSNKYIMADVSQLVMALMGFDPSKPENQKNPALRELVAKYTRASLGSVAAKAELAQMEATFADGQFIGQHLKLECVKVPTRPSVKNPEGGQFTAHRWSPKLVAPAPVAS